MGKEATWATEKKRKILGKLRQYFSAKKLQESCCKKSQKNIEKQKIFKTSFQGKQKFLEISKTFSSKKDFKKFYRK